MSVYVCVCVSPDGAASLPAMGANTHSHKHRGVRAPSVWRGELLSTHRRVASSVREARRDDVGMIAADKELVNMMRAPHRFPVCAHLNVRVCTCARVCVESHDVLQSIAWTFPTRPLNKHVEIGRIM